MHAICRTRIVDITQSAMGKSLNIERDVGDVAMCTGTLAQMLDVKDTPDGK